MVKGKITGQADLNERASNGMHLLRELLGDEYPAGTAQQPVHWLRFLMFARAAKKRGNWPQVRFLLMTVEPDLRDAQAFRWNIKELGVVREKLERTIGAYVVLEQSLKDLEAAFEDAIRAAVDAKLWKRSRLIMAHDLVLRELARASAVPIELLAHGTNDLARRMRLEMSTRVGLAAALSAEERMALEDDMLKVGFSQSQIGTLIDGPKGSAKARGRKVANRLRGRQTK